MDIKRFTCQITITGSFMPRFLPRQIFKFAFVFIFVLTAISFGQDFPRRDEYDVFATNFRWLEIEDIGETVDELTDNGLAGPFDIGFQFSYFGRVYEQFWVSANGFIGLGPAVNYGSQENTLIPEDNYPNNIIALFWKDLNPEAFWADGSVFYGTRDNSLVVQYQDIAERNQDGRVPQNTITMQVILKRNGDIVMQYNRIGEAFDLSEGTVGAENHNGENGVLVRYNGEGAEIGERTAFLISEQGPGNFLVWDAGLRTPSGAAEVDALEFLGHQVTLLRLVDNQNLPEDLEDYEAVFVNLGNFGVNGQFYHELTDQEGSNLAEYLDNGGSLYMEGSDTWNQDDVTAVHPYFKISGIADGAPLEPPVTGLDGSLAAGMRFDQYNAQDNNYIDQLASVDDAVPVFRYRQGNVNRTGMISYINRTYKTIGCSFEFGGLVNAGQSTRTELMDRIVRFFRSSSPQFPAPINLEARAGDGAVDLSWEMPEPGIGYFGEILRLEREVAHIRQNRENRKLSAGEKERVLELQTRLQELHERAVNRPQRDEVEGFSIYVNGEEYDFTNAHGYSVIELENNVEHNFEVVAVYNDPIGESEPAGPVSAVPHRAVSIGWGSDFEENNGALTALPSFDSWEWGESEIDAYSGERVWATGLDRGYSDLVEWYLYLPEVDLARAERAWFGFYQYMNCEGGWDGGRVEVSTDGGNRWSILYPRGGYPEQSVFAFNGGPGFSGNSGGWESVNFDLNDYLRSRIRLRLVFKSDDSNFREYPGWFIDNMYIISPEVERVEILVSDDGPLDGARVTLGDENGPFDEFGATSDVNGSVVFNEVPAGEYVVRAQRIGYSPASSDIFVEVGVDNTFDIFMDVYESRIGFYDENNQPVQELEVEVDYGGEAPQGLRINNTLGMATDYMVYINYFPRDNPVIDSIPEFGDPWDLIKTYDLSESTGEQFFIGAEFIRYGSPAQYQLIATSGDFRDGENRFYRYSRSGRFFQGFIQNTWRIAGWGLRDLTYDGQYIYGSSDNDIFQLEVDGNFIDNYEMDYLAVNRAITWIPEEDAFWIGDWDDTWFKVNLDGDLLDSYHDHGLTGVVGFAWNADDPDGFPLYVHNQEPDDGGAMIYRFNPETWERADNPFRTVEPGEGTAGGTFVTNLYDTHHNTLGVLIQERDRDVVKLYSLDRDQSWISVAPTHGTIDGASSIDFTVDLQAGNIVNDDKTAVIELHDLRSGNFVQLSVLFSIMGGAAFLNGTVDLSGNGEDDITEVLVTLGNHSTHPALNGEVYTYDFGNLAPGAYTLTATLNGYIPYSEEIDFEPNAVLERNIVLDPIPKGVVSGTVISIYDSPIENFEIVALAEDDEGWYQTAVTDEEGMYILEIPTGFYTIQAHLNGWRTTAENGVEVIEDQTAEVNFVAWDTLGVRSVHANGNFDNKIVLTWPPQGLTGDEVNYQYDSGVLADAIYLINRQDILTVKFEPIGQYDVLDMTVYILNRANIDAWGLTRNRDNRLYFYVFAEDPETGMPGELLFSDLVDEHFENRGHLTWITINTEGVRFREGPFFVGWSQHPDDSRYEYGGLDDAFDNAGSVYLTLDGEWRQYDGLPGDPIIRATTWNYIEEQEEEMFAGRVPRLLRPTLPADDKISILPRDSFRLLNVNASEPFRLKGSPVHSFLYPSIVNPRRDEFVTYRIYIDGELEVESLDETQWDHEIGSENENIEYTYNVKALHVLGEEEFEIGDNEAVAWANQSPHPVTGVTIIRDGTDFTISWTRPQLNDDNTECTDYAGSRLFLNGELAALTGPDDVSWSGSVELGDEGWYELRIEAFDEVPNYSAPVTLTIPLGIATVYDFEDFNPGIFQTEHDSIGWNRSDNTLYGPGGGHSGRWFWGTAPLQGRYLNNADWRISTTSEFMVNSAEARLDFFSYINAEDGRDGGQVLISVDGGDWELLTPLDDYQDQTVAAFINQPAFTGNNLDWQMVSIELGEFEDQLIRLQWRFKADQTISWLPGWYIDDVAIWACGVPERVQVSGIVRDQDSNPVQGAKVVIDRLQSVTNVQGVYVIPGIVARPAEMTVSKTGYMTTTQELNLVAGQNVQANTSISAIAISADPQAFGYDLGPGDRVQTSLNIQNMTSGAGLPFSINLQATMGAQRDEFSSRTLRKASGVNPRRDEPWDIHFDIDLFNSTGMRRFMGAEYANDEFVLSVADPVHGANIVRLDHDGELIRTFRQPVNVQGWGLRDLAWDGEQFYASQGSMIYSFDLDGELTGEIQGAPITVNRALAYDIEEDAFWTGEYDSPWYLVNRDGEVQALWEDHGLTGVFGFACHPEANDNMPLYILNKEDDNTTVIYKANPREQEIERLVEVDGAPAGCFLTGNWDANYWIIGAIIGGNEQHLLGFETNRRVGWLSVEPDQGEIEVDGNQDVEVNIQIPQDASAEDEFTGSIIVSSFGFRAAEIPVSINILEEFRFFNDAVETDQFMNIAINDVDFSGGELPVSSEIAVITPRGDVGGVVRWTGLPVDFMCYSGEQGFRVGEYLDFRIWNAVDEMEYTPEVHYLQGFDLFSINACVTVELSHYDADWQRIDLQDSWNLVSSYIEPDDNRIVNILSDINDNGNLIIVKNWEGHFWWPEYDYNGISTWDGLMGYQINVRESDNFTVVGRRFDVETPIPLHSGWNMISYLLDEPVEPVIAMGEILDHIIIAKDGEGRFIAPEFDYYGMPPMSPAKGYQVNVNRRLDLVYRTADERLAIQTDDLYTQPWKRSTGSDMSLLITELKGLTDLATPVLEVHAGKESRIVGQAEISQLPCGVIIYGDDQTTDGLDGAMEGEFLTLSLLNDGEKLPITYSIITGDLTFRNNGFSVLKIQENNATVPERFSLGGIYPNPFNGRTSIEFGLPQISELKVRVTDLSGRLIYQSNGIIFGSGWHSLSLDGNTWPSGLYLISLEAANEKLSAKLILIR